MEPNPDPQPQMPSDQAEEIEPIIEQEQVTEQPYFNEEVFEQSDPIPDQTEIVVTDNTSDSLPNYSLPVNELITPPLAESDVVTLTTPVDDDTSATVVLPRKKKSLLWLWLTIGAVLVVAGGLVAGLLVIKSVADTAAHTYTTNVKSYLADIDNVATSQATNSSNVKKAVAAIKVPVLAPTLLGGASSDYTAADKLQTEVTNNVNTFTTKVNGYAQVYSFYTGYTGLASDLHTIDTKGAASTVAGSRPFVSSYLGNYRDKLGEIKKLINGATVPSDLSANVKEFGRVYGEMYTNWSAMASAFDSNNNAAYDAAYNKYVVSGAELSGVKFPITNYFNTLPVKIRDSAKELQTYSNTIKY